MKHNIDKENKIYVIFVGQIIIFVAILGVATTFSYAQSVYAQNDSDMTVLQQEIDDLYIAYDQMQIQVVAQEITKDDAQEKWDVLVDDIYKKKTDVFNKKIEELIVQCEALDDNTELMKKITSIREWRVEQNVAYEKICVQVDAIKKQASQEIMHPSAEKKVSAKNDNQIQTKMSEENGMQRPTELPDEFFDVCDDKDEGDSCEFTMTDPEGEERDIDGKCAQSPQDDDQLMCISTDMRGGLGGSSGR